MSNSTDANVIKTEAKAETKTPLLVLAYFAFRSKHAVVDKIIDRFKILPIGSNAKFKNLAEEWKNENSYPGIVTTCVLTPDENDVDSLKRCINQLNRFAKQKSKESNIEKVDIMIFVPENSFRSLNLVFSRYFLAPQDNNSYNKVDDKWKILLGERMKIEDDNIKVIKYSEMPLSDITCEDINENISSSCISTNQPSSKDAMIAAILCEYAYALVRKHNDENRKGNIISRKVLLRDSSDSERYTNTVKEIGQLEIIPNKWKRIVDAPEMGADSPIINLLGLQDWDAISIGGLTSSTSPGWLGMAKNQRSWEGSLSQRIVKELNNKFSLIGNKGILNTWFGLAKNSGFGSVIFVNESTKTVMYCTVGSDFGKDILFNGDWTTTNISQFLTGLSPQYQQSVTNAEILDDIFNTIEKEEKAKLFFIGHSLGGGLASNNAIITKDRHAITFNAAGLNWLRVPVSLLKTKPSQLLHPFKRRERVHLFIIKGEILDMGQSLLSPTPWILTNLNLDLPGKARAYSSPNTRKEIDPPCRKDGKLPNSLERHSLVNYMTPPQKIFEIEI